MTIAAFFDVDGTLTRTDVVQPLVQFELSRRSGSARVLWLLPLLASVPYYLWLDRRNRACFIERFYRRYAGLSAEEVSGFARATFGSHVLPRLFPGAVRCLEQHRQQGHRLVLVTGGLEVWVRPLADHLRVDDWLAVQMLQEDGRFTGRLEGPPLIAEEKARRVQEYAREHDIHLASSYAYADSISDLPLLAIVGHPVAVRADGALRKVAAERGWRVVEW